MKRRSKVSATAAKARRSTASKPKRGLTPSKPPSPDAGDQAEIARLTGELNEAWAQQAATSEVLHVISSSLGDLKPVFASILEKAVRICDAKFGIFNMYEDGFFPVAAMHNVPEAFVELRRREPKFAVRSSHPLARVATTKQVLHIADITTEAGYLERDASFIAFVELAGGRSLLAVPMLKEVDLLGVIAIFRKEVRPFTDKQIEVVQNFASQAVIAIENARLLNELRQRTTDLTEALEQQTATTEVLQVVNASPGNLGAVFDVMLEKALDLCEAAFGGLWTYDGQRMHAMAMRGVPALFGQFHSKPLEPIPGTASYDLVRGERFVHIADITEDEGYRSGNPAKRALHELGGARTTLWLPLRKDDALLGTFMVYRKEARPFTDKQIALLENFAAQAVIAMENARLLNELHQRTSDLTESLEQQTATSEVLQVVSSSPGDLGPVFATMLQNAVRICDAKWGTVHSWDGDALHLMATLNTPTAFAEARERIPLYRPHPQSLLGRIVTTKNLVHIEDAASEQVYTERLDPAYVAAVELGGVRTAMGVPMMQENKLLGAFAVARQEVRPFTDKQIALLQNFAAQAVIAIENARLLNELRQRTNDLTERTADLTEALEQQTATSEVLQVISSSPGDLEPVFATMLENAVQICDAKFGNIYRWDDEALHLVATHNTPPAFAEARRYSLFKCPGPQILVACCRPKQLFMLRTSRQNLGMVTKATEARLQPSNLGVCGPYSRCPCGRKVN